MVEIQVPARIDRLLRSRWHTLVILALGVTWILDGLEATIQGNIADVLTGTGDRGSLFIGYLVAADLMVVAALVELILGMRAERRSLESVAAPLTAIQQETGATT